ncbi:MAG: hypothetical protein H8E71_09100 [Candidatus Marinimicrobia bacterium]|nr:hypothetical protein [Candidatus Neomarinimicrobiota bacterium]
MSPLNLFEYTWEKPLPNSLKKDGKFETFMDDIWKARPKAENWYSEEIDEAETDKSKQRFIRFRSNEFSPRNYVGVIRYDNTEINLLPKIFYKDSYKENKEKPSPEEIQNIHLHILYWLSYNKKIRFPKSLSDFKSIKIEGFFEILILMFATYTRDAMNRVLYQNYHDINQDNQFIKGRLDVNGYIKNNITTGNWQRITCDYDTFDIDNRFNRIIKYVSKMLLSHTENDTSQKLLYEIVFLLDDVEDVQMTYDDCEKVHLNPFYKELNAALDYCKLFLSNSMVYSYKDEFEVFAFLLPMEKIFEDFVGGFLKENPKTENENDSNVEIDKWNIQTQKSNVYISEHPEKVFQMKPDIYLEKIDQILIIDTKYKILKGNDYKKGVSQGDMYQMVSYGIRYEVEKIVLLYPTTIDDSTDSKNPISEFIVKDEFATLNPKEEIQKKQKINIRVHKLPIICEYKEHKNNYMDLKEKLDKQISTRLSKILQKV